MTDKVHPVVEAMARAMFDHEWSPDPCPPLWENEDEESRRYWFAHAKAAAKVLLSMEPTEGMKRAACPPGPRLTPAKQWEAMTSRAREEMGG